MISEFSMEYRTTHGKVLAKLEKKKHERERKKTKGKFIVSRATLKSKGRFTIIMAQDLAVWCLTLLCGAMA